MACSQAPPLTLSAVLYRPLQELVISFNEPTPGGKRFWREHMRGQIDSLVATGKSAAYTATCFLDMLTALRQYCERWPEQRSLYECDGRTVGRLIGCIALYGGLVLEAKLVRDFDVAALIPLATNVVSFCYERYRQSHLEKNVT